MEIVRVCAVLLSFALSFTSSDKFTADLNTILDEVMKNVATSGADIGLEPLVIPDIRKINDTEALILTEGEVRNIVSIQRYGDAQALYDENKLTLKGGVQFTQLESKFQFDMKKWGLNPVGNLSVVAPDLKVLFDVSVDTADLTAQINNLIIPSVGDLEVSVNTSTPVYGLVMQELVAAITLLFQDEVVNLIAKELANQLNQTLNSLLAL